MRWRWWNLVHLFYFSNWWIGADVFQEINSVKEKCIQLKFFFYLVTCPDSWQNADTWLFEKLELLTLSCCSHFCACQAPWGSHPIPDMRKTRWSRNDKARGGGGRFERLDSTRRRNLTTPSAKVSTNLREKKPSMQEKFACQALTCCCLSNWVFITVSWEPCY